MRLSFSQLEAARQNPHRFGASFGSRAIRFNACNFRTFLVSAIKLFHQTKDETKAVQQFEKVCRAKLAHQQHFEPRFEHYRGVLLRYCQNFPTQECKVIEIKRRAVLKLGAHRLTGIIERLDLRMSQGYRVTLTQLETKDWRHELRWPLMQKAIAEEFGCALTEIEVGVFAFDSGQYEYKTFSVGEVRAAEQEALKILDSVEENLPDEG